MMTAAAGDGEKKALIFPRPRRQRADLVDELIVFQVSALLAIHGPNCLRKSA